MKIPTVDWIGLEHFQRFDLFDLPGIWTLLPRIHRLQTSELRLALDFGERLR
jgi:hypothetical protein